MLGLSHVLLGAAVGKRISSPVLAFGAGVASHLIVDKIPHFWSKTKKGQNNLMIIDIALVLLVFVIFLNFPFYNKTGIFWGAFGGGLVDFILVIVPFFIFPKFINNPVRVWHEKRQYHFSKPVYLLTDLALSIISLILILV